jgi:hypothetical protein
MVLAYDIEKFHINPESATWLGSGGNMDQHASRTFLINDTCYDTLLSANSDWNISGQFDSTIAGKTGTRFQTLNKGIAKGGADLPPDGSSVDIFEIKLTAQSNTSFDSADFEVFVQNTRQTDVTPAVCVTGPLGGGEPSTASYTVAATSDGASATVGEAFNVDVALTAEPTMSGYASVQAGLAYDSALVTPDLAGVENVSQEAAGKLKITYGPTSGGEVGDGVLLATIPFTPTAAGIAVFSVPAGATVTLSGQSETDEDVAAASGENLSVTIAAAVTIEFDTSYAGLPDGYKLLMYVLSEKPTVFYTYGGENMHYVLKDGKHYVTYIVADSVDKEEALEPQLTSEAYTNDGDLNGGGLRIADAQIAYDIANGHANYDAMGGLGIQARLKADVNGDGQVDDADVLAIKNAIHGGDALPFAA